MRCKFNWWSAHETCVREVRAAFANRWTKWAKLIARDLLERSCEDMQSVKNTVAGDGSWVYGYDPETKHQSSQWKGPTSPRPKKGRGVWSTTKVMLLAFLILSVSYTTRTLLMGKQLTRNSTWSSVHVCVNRFAEKNRKNGGMANGSWTTTMRQPAHTSQIVQQFLPNHGTAQLQQPPYSPDLLHRVTFSYWQVLRKFCKYTDFRQRRTPNEIRRRHY